MERLRLEKEKENAPALPPIQILEIVKAHPELKLVEELTAAS